MAASEPIIRTISKVRWVDSTKNPTDSTISEVHRKIRRTDSGWVMTSRPISTITTSDGRVMDNPIARVLQTVTAKCKLDSAGLITKVAGFESITPRIDSIALGPNSQRLREVLSPENLSAKEEMDWNEKLQGLHGKTIKIGWIDYDTTTDEVRQVVMEKRLILPVAIDGTWVASDLRGFATRMFGARFRICIGSAISRERYEGRLGSTLDEIRDWTIREIDQGRLEGTATRPEGWAPGAIAAS